MPSLSHCWKPSRPGAGCGMSPPHCPIIQRTSTCSSSGSYCRSIFCCTSRLSPYDGPRLAMPTAGGSAGHREPPCQPRLTPRPQCRSPLGTQGDTGTSWRCGSARAGRRGRILPGQARWMSGTEPYHPCQALPGCCPPLPASCSDPSRGWGARSMHLGDPPVPPTPAKRNPRGAAAPCPPKGPPPAARASSSQRLGPAEAWTWQELAAGRSLFAKLAPFVRDGCQIRDRPGSPTPPRERRPSPQPDAVPSSRPAELRLQLHGAWAMASSCPPRPTPPALGLRPHPGRATGARWSPTGGCR